MAKLKQNRKWNETIRIGESSFDPSNANDCAIQGMILRAARNDNFESVGNLLELAGAMKVQDSSDPVGIKRVTTTYTMEKNGKTSTTTQNAVVATMLNDGWTIQGQTESEVIE